jgi:hypothetical protein
MVFRLPNRLKDVRIYFKHLWFFFQLYEYDFLLTDSTVLACSHLSTGILWLYAWCVVLIHVYKRRRRIFHSRLTLISCLYRSMMIIYPPSISFCDKVSKLVYILSVNPILFLHCSYSDHTFCKFWNIFWTLFFSYFMVTSQRSKT